MKYKIEVLKSKGKYFWRLKAMNGRTLAHSEKYNPKKSCLKTSEGLENDLEGSVIVFMDDR